MPEARRPPQLTNRTSGVLLHLCSLPGPYGIGDLGDAARGFADFLHGAGQRWWLMLPVSPIGAGNSPYSTISSFAGEPLYISPERLWRKGLLKRRDFEGDPGMSSPRVRYDLARRLRWRLLRRAFENAGSGGGEFFTSDEFQKFRRQQSYWLRDYTLFCALTEHYGTPDWSRWPHDLKFRKEGALRAARKQFAEKIRFHQFLQYHFHHQWQDLKRDCALRGIGLIGDLPIFVSYESADVWAHPRYFLLDKNLHPTHVAGVPPDYFSSTGQLWGNALYRWPTLKADDYSWWMARFRRILQLFDTVRLDHFIGFYRFWRIPAGDDTAINGRWVRAPGQDFFDAFKRKQGRLPFIAEDLGQVIPPVWDLRDRYGLPGMKVLQFAFDGGDGPNIHKPYNYPANCVAFTGTHDNNTALAWYREIKPAAGEGPAAQRKTNQKKLAHIRTYFGDREKDVPWEMARVAMMSPANTVITPVQDLLALGGKHRMNTPGTPTGNWVWRLKPGTLTTSVKEKLRGLTEATGRTTATERQ